MIKRWSAKDCRSVLKRVVVLAVCIALPVIAWAQWSTSGSNIYNGNTGNVGIGTSSPGVALELAQNTALRLGNANISSGGNYAHFGTHAWFDGSQWQSDGSGGGMYQIVGQAHRWWKHDGYGNFSQLMMISDSGNVGIGTGSPSSKLDVAGDVTVSGNISAKYQDIAEWVSTSHVLPAGTVVALNTESDNGIVPSSIPYDTHVAGVVSDSPGIILGIAGPGKVKIATTGRVKVHVDAGNSPIRRGDLLVTGTKEGTAMRSEMVSVGGVEIHRPGTLIGKALEPLDSGEGEILVLLSLQ